MHYELNRWIRKRWETEHRYYVAELCQDMFGCWLIRRSLGGKLNHRGSSLTTQAQDYEHAHRLLEEVAKRRKTRGYQLHDCSK